MNQPIFEKIKEKSEELFNMISRTSESSGMLDESVKGTPTSGGATTLTSGIGSMSGSFADDKPKGPIGQYFSTLHKEFIQVKTALPSGSPTTITWWKNTVKVLQDSKLGMRIFYGLCRMMVSMYFFNNAWSDLYEYWYKYDVISFPFIKVPVLICSALMFFNVLTLYVGIFLCLFAFGDALKIIIERLLMFVLEGRFYINELMTKKMAMFAGSLMVLIQEPFFKKGLEETSKFSFFLSPLSSRSFSPFLFLSLSPSLPLSVIPLSLPLFQSILLFSSFLFSVPILFPPPFSSSLLPTSLCILTFLLLLLLLLIFPPSSLLLILSLPSPPLSPQGVPGVPCGPHRPPTHQQGAVRPPPHRQSSHRVPLHRRGHTGDL